MCQLNWLREAQFSVVHYFWVFLCIGYFVSLSQYLPNTTLEDKRFVWAQSFRRFQVIMSRKDGGIVKTMVVEHVAEAVNITMDLDA